MLKFMETRFQRWARTIVYDRWFARRRRRKEIFMIIAMAAMIWTPLAFGLEGWVLIAAVAVAVVILALVILEYYAYARAEAYIDHLRRQAWVDEMAARASRPAYQPVEGFTGLEAVYITLQQLRGMSGKNIARVLRDEDRNFS